MLLELAAFSLITMSGAAAASRRSFAFLGTDAALPALYLTTEQSTNSATVSLPSSSLYVPPLKASGTVEQGGIPPADAGEAKLRVRAPAPVRKGPVDRYLERVDVSNGIDGMLAAIEASLPGYPSILEVVQDPDGGDNSAFLMLNICMSPQDQNAWDFVDSLIDQHWLNLSPDVRRVLGVGRELVSVD